MKVRTLGSTGIEVSEIGFGAWGIGGNVGGHIAYGKTDDNESRKALRHAFESGITFYDTADFYGFGHSEKLIGETLKDVRSKIVIASKVGLIDYSGKQDYSPVHIRESVEGSLERLQTDYIDLYQLHSPPINVLEEGDDIIAALNDLKDEGKIRAYGNSLNVTEDGKPCVEKYGFECIQVNLNMLDQRAVENGLLDLCKNENVGVVARTPLSFGFLTGACSGRDTFGENDHRNRWQHEQIKRWSAAINLFSEVLQKYSNQTPAQIALRFCLSHDGVSTVIPGMLNKKEVEENAGASEFGKLDREDIRIVAEIYRSQDIFLGKKGQ